MSLNTILAVDDEPDILVAIEDLFEDEFRVLTTSKPEEALAILREEPDVAVIISDQRMPGMAGDAMLAQARAFHDGQAILLTGYADISAVIAALNQGGIIGYVTKPWDPLLLRRTVRNAVERFQLGRDLATERALLLGLLNHSSDAISFKDAEGRLVRLNARKAARLGLDDPSNAIGRLEGEFLPASAAGSVKERDSAAIAQAEPSQAVIAEGSIGAESWYDVTRVPIRSLAGEVTHLATIERDITEQKALEARLRQSDKMQALGTLAGGIAHDFNNLLTVILGSLELARPKVSDQPRLERLIDNATSAAQRGSALTKRLLSFSRSRDLRLRVIDANALIEGMNELFRSSLGGLVRVETDLDPALPQTSIDPDQLELAILNLCINARDAMPEGGVITVSTRRVSIADDPDLALGDYALITISDQGSGIPPEILERVCEPFFTTKGVGQGTGLGLAMVFGLAQQVKGRLNITSEVGQGTQVELAIPSADDLAEFDEPDETRAAPPPAAGPARILVVDDDAEVRHVTASFLNDFGYTESEASDGATALAMMERISFDLVVADLAMPGMTGLELAAEVRQRFSEVPVLILTGHAEAMELPEDLPVLAKPFGSAELAARVSSLLSPT